MDNKTGAARVGTKRALNVEFVFPEGIKKEFVSNILIQNGEHEFVISFFQAEPPLLTGTSKEELEQKVKEISSVRAFCVSRIIVSHEKIGQFIEALQHAQNSIRKSATSPK